jgi:type I restriction enzyme S subunit
MTFPEVPLSDILILANRPETPASGKLYRQIGVRLWGEGAYEREPIDGAATQYQRLFQAKANDVIVNKIWARNGSVAVVPEHLDGCYGSNEFPMFIPRRDKLEPRWFHWLTKTKGFWTKCDEKSRGTSGKNRIRPERFLAIEIPLPTLSEQRRIATQIEELAGRVDRAQVIRQQAIEATEALAASLLVTILPRSIQTKALSELVAPDTKISYGVLVPGPDVEDGVPFVRVQDLDMRNQPKLPNKRIAAEVDAQYERTRLQGGEILVGVVGSIGKVGIAPMSWKGANIARAVCRIVPSREIDRDYLALVLSAKPSQDYFRETTRTLAQPTLNVAQLSETPVPLPSLTEQRRIVEKIRILQGKISVLNQLQSENRIELDVLLPSILDKAFNGEL